MMESETLVKHVTEALEGNKAENICVMDVRGISSITDFMIIASGHSTRQVRGMAEKAMERAKGLGVKPLGIEGQAQGEWVLVDLGDVVVHAMLPATRVFYQLEKLWGDNLDAVVETNM